MLVMWAEKVESDCSIDCSSPMSGEDVVENGDAGTSLGGHRQSGLGHEAEQSDGLQGDGFAAGVGSGDEDAAGVGSERSGDRNDVAGEHVGVEQGVSRRVEDQVLRPGTEPVEVVVFGWEWSVQCLGEAGLGLGEIDLGEAADGGSDGSGFVADRLAEGSEDAFDFSLLFAPGLAQPVAELDDSERLDEERRA